MLLRLFASVLLLALAAPEALASKRVALVIANSDYAHLPKLDKVLADARPLREALASDLGFDVIYGENLGRREMNRKIKELEAQVAKDDIVFIYFGGHGVSLSGENYLLPTELQQPEPGEEKFVMGDSFGAAALTKQIKAKGARITFAVLDASRNNPFEGQSIGLKSGLERMTVDEGVFVLYSAGPSQLSRDSLSNTDQNVNSVFMRSLIPALKITGLSHVDLAKKVQAEVSTTAAAAGYEQTPIYFDQTRELVTLNGKTGEEYTEAKPAATDPALILEEWKIVRDSGNRAALEGFRAKYGSDPVWGPLIDEALQKLDKGSAPASAGADPSSTFDEDEENKPLYRDLQIELKRVGCYSGDADGVWGPESQRALVQFAQRRGLSLQVDVNALEMVIDAEKGTCSELATPRKTVEAVPPPPRKATARLSKPRKTVRPKRRASPPRSSRVCWTCFDYYYNTTKVCVPRSIGNPAIRIPGISRCMRG